MDGKTPDLKSAVKACTPRLARLQLIKRPLFFIFVGFRGLQCYEKYYGKFDGRYLIGTEGHKYTFLGNIFNAAQEVAGDKVTKRDSIGIIFEHEVADIVLDALGGGITFESL